ncbi:uncharacterized protein LAJ45_07877 [Morchella importuna]|uniref:uncharacterized protein n=1 Tax=Morchella importuna TaxID=1174673 RepID=UPI001E8E7507|nr:uncharacterized protein LAJ45_07877 [Morchella importuna]KAH8148113.1 hypothetical protein LAJ45_07877 [Morchella importuna]
MTRPPQVSTLPSQHETAPRKQYYHQHNRPGQVHSILGGGAGRPVRSADSKSILPEGELCQGWAMSCIQVHRRRAQPTTASSRLMAQDVHHDGHDDADSTGDQELALWFCYNQALHGVQGWTRAGVDCL